MWLAFGIVDISFCAWSNIIFTLVCHNYFYYALIAIGYISNYERKKVKNVDPIETTNGTNFFSFLFFFRGKKICEKYYMLPTGNNTRSNKKSEQTNGPN